MFIRTGCSFVVKKEKKSSLRFIKLSRTRKTSALCSSFSWFNQRNREYYKERERERERGRERERERERERGQNISFVFPVFVV